MAEIRRMREQEGATFRQVFQGDAIETVPAKRQAARQEGEDGLPGAGDGVLHEARPGPFYPCGLSRHDATAPYQTPSDCTQGSRLKRPRSVYKCSV